MTVRFNVIGYLIAEGFKNVFKNKKSTSASLIIMCFTMLIFGVFFMIGRNINNMMAQLEGAQGIQVFLREISEEKTKEVEQQLNQIDGVHRVQYVSKTEALNQMKSQFKDKEYLLAGYEENNIFPASYVVTLTDLTRSREVQSNIEKIDTGKEEHDKVIKRITSKDETITALIKIANGVRIVTGVILIFLIIISVFIISNTIKLTVHARRKEITIMKYVGATNSFIRWPFIVEGIVIGILAGALSILIVGIVYNAVATEIVSSEIMASMNISLLTFSDMFGLIAIVYLVLGVGIGILGSAISMRKYLKV